MSITIDDLIEGWKAERARLAEQFLKLGVRPNVIRWGSEDVSDEVRADFVRRIGDLDRLIERFSRDNLPG